MSRSSTNTYVLYERADGTATPHWQYCGRPKVPGCVRIDGQLLPPDPRWIVRARTAREACFFANESITSMSRDDTLGIWCDGEEPSLGGSHDWVVHS